jgi:serine protease SohB
MFNFLKYMAPKAVSPIRVRNLNNEFISYERTMDKASGRVHGIDSIRQILTRKNGRLFVIDFKGDVMATQSAALSEEITAILSSADPKKDEVLVRLESPGGAVHAYGYASSQLQRLKSFGIKLTISVDKVAASGGYMMACIGDHILSAPFAVIGSIGVVAEFMNFNQILQDIGIDYKQYTAGKYKRTVGAMGPITEEAETKFNSDLERTHQMFKDHIARFRSSVDIESLATGEHWYGMDAQKNGLVDSICTSEDYILESIESREVLHVKYAPQLPFVERIRIGMVKAVGEIVLEMISFRANLKL